MNPTNYTANQPISTQAPQPNPTNQPNPPNPTATHHPKARKHCRATESVVADFKAAAAAVEALCRGVADGMLVDVERRKLYELPEFEEVQAAHHAKVGGWGVGCECGCWGLGVGFLLLGIGWGQVDAELR
jgi:hypothetical protein